MKQKKPLSSYVEMLRTMIAILISLIIVFAIILLISSQPLSALGDFIFGPLTSVRRFGNVIEGMTPLMFTGLAVIILFKPGLFNLSMEGAFFIGAVAACAASLGLGLSGKTALIVAMAAAAVAGVNCRALTQKIQNQGSVAHSYTAHCDFFTVYLLKKLFAIQANCPQYIIIPFYYT